MSDKLSNNPPPDWAINPGNWIAISREVREHPIVGAGQPVKPDDPRKGSYSRMEAWFDLLCLAQFKPSRISNRGDVMTLDVGQLMGARSYLAMRWNWTEKTVRGFLATLEDDGMISFGSPQINELEGQQRASNKINKANVITICNYSRYQLMSEAIEKFIEDKKGQQRASGGPAKGPANGQQLGQQTASDKTTLSKGILPVVGTPVGQQEVIGGATTQIEKGPQLNTITKERNNPPTPQGGLPLEDFAKPAAKSRKRGEINFSDADIALSNRAVELYNEFAIRLKFTRSQVVDPQIRLRLLGRIRDIGGIDQFKTALTAIELSPFLMGKIPARPNESPFRLDLERLLQNGGGLGNVLVRLINMAAERGDVAAQTGGGATSLRATIAAMSDEQQVEYVKRYANGIWPIDKLLAPPIHKDCVFKTAVLQRAGVSIDQYTETGMGTKK